jgi:hypothetical protein
MIFVATMTVCGLVVAYSLAHVAGDLVWWIVGAERMRRPLLRRSPPPETAA